MQYYILILAAGAILSACGPPEPVRLGIHLVIGLAQQLDGALTVDARPPGVRFVLVFKPQERTI